MNKIKQNLGFQTAYQLLSTMLPLITSPYLSRVLGAEQLGVYSYTNSIVQYFVLVAMLGTVNYGTRSVASCREDKNKCASVFANVFSLQLLTSSLMIVFYTLYIITVCKKNRLIALLQIIQLLNCLLDINWLFFGLEEFKLTVTRNFIVKGIVFVALFLFVKKESDLWIYTVLMSSSALVSQIFLWSKLPRWCRNGKASWREMKKNLKPNIALFIPLLAMSVYHTMDKTMLGFMSSDAQSGFYYNADKLINIPLTIITGFGTVLLPRITNLIESDRDDQAKMMFSASLEGVILAACAMSFGIAAIAKEFVPLFFGEEFIECVEVTIVLAPVLVIKGVSNTIRTEFLIPYHLEKKLTTSVVIGAIVNLFMNCLLIPHYGAIGAALGTLVAELTACVCQIHCVKTSIHVGKVLLESIGYCLCGALMFIIVRGVADYLNGGIVSIVFEILIGGVVFCITSVLTIVLSKSELRVLLHKRNVN